MGLADFFTLENFSIHSILYFIIMVNLFMNYFGKFDHAIDEEGKNKGIFLIYSHYPIFIGLIMVTVSMSFLVNPEVHHHFATGFFYTGIGLFQAAILANGYFNKSHLKYDKLYYGLQATFFLIGLVLSLLFFCLSNHCHLHRNCDDLSNGNSFYAFLYDTNQEIFNSELGFVLKKISSRHPLLEFFLSQ